MLSFIVYVRCNQKKVSCRKGFFALITSELVRVGKFPIEMNNGKK